MNIEKLSQELAEAISAQDNVSIEKASEKIAELVAERKKIENQHKADLKQKAHRKKILPVAKKYPCIKCGGKLKYADEYHLGLRFDCVVCKVIQRRDPDMKEEDRVQLYIKNRISKFKSNIIKVLNMANADVDYNKDFTIVNGKRFFVWQRDPFLWNGVLAYEYNGLYNHESLAKGHEDDWSGDSLKGIPCICSIMGFISSKESHRLDNVLEDEWLKKIRSSK